ncbi:hypothetical protein ACPCSC_31995 [Streptomyces lavendulocolor]|uniref:hypothetical protein n=1 Tax=Streptomyces lavendulocolor TaxID=67316 RepID=UPI003C2C2991
MFGDALTPAVDVVLLTAVLSVAAVAARRLAGRDPAAVPPSPYTPAKQGRNDMTRVAGTAAGEAAVEIRHLVVLRGETASWTG